ncbi:hypothetical protein EXIGLDRAFT_444792 [Exidia glandulosa HHB12029]|uniref:Uncharacterized protein n=1 Tax=Exidia glandulosa HHB12029 TaxID=1314781 RepID=A0A165B6E0_EXIGL|nr:hypothetical protein EXIGLDRAFT_444792 [Exidia glandulosa HHB12029]
MRAAQILDNTKPSNRTISALTMVTRRASRRYSSTSRIYSQTCTSSRSYHGLSRLYTTTRAKHVQHVLVRIAMTFSQALYSCIGASRKELLARTSSRPHRPTPVHPAAAQPALRPGTDGDCTTPATDATGSPQRLM